MISSGKRAVALAAEMILLACLPLLADNTVKLDVSLSLTTIAPEEEGRIFCSVPVTVTVTEQPSGLEHSDAFSTRCTGKISIDLPPGSVYLHVYKKQTITTLSGSRYQVSLRGDATIEDNPLPGPNPGVIPLTKTKLPSVSARLSMPLGVSIVLARFDLPTANQDATPRPFGEKPQTITATVEDSSQGSSLDDVSVVVESTETGEQLNGVVEKTGPSGFRFTMPPRETYLVTFSARDHDSFTVVLSSVGQAVAFYDASGKTRSDRILLGRKTLHAAEAAPLEVIQTSRRESFTPELISLLPLAQPRNLDDILKLSPGVADAPQTVGIPGPALSPGVGTPGSFTVNGLRSRQNDFTFDGSDINDEETGSRRQGFGAPYPEPIESLTSLYMITAVGDARYGRSLGGHVDALSRSGGPKLHGQLYGFASGGPFRARNFFDLSPKGYAPGLQSLIPVTWDGTLNGTQAQLLNAASYKGPMIVQKRLLYQFNPLQIAPSDNRFAYGFNLGGAINPRTHFFISAEREVRDSRSQSNFSVPTMKQRSTNKIGDAGTEKAVFPTSIGGDAIFSLIPLPNNPIGPYGPNTYTDLQASGSRGYLYTAKLDRSLGHASELSVRWNQTRDATDLPSIDDAISSSIRPITGTANLASFLTTRIKAQLFNTLRFSLGLTSVRFDPIANPVIASGQITSGPDSPFLLNAPILLNESTTSPRFVYPGPSTTPAQQQAEFITGPLGQVDIAGYSPVGLDTYHYPQHRSDNTLQFADTLSWTRGQHTIYAGFDTRGINLNTYVDRNARKLLEFYGMRNGSNPQQFIPAVALAGMDTPAAVLQTLSTGAPESSIQLEQRQLDFFVQDYYRLKPNLTVNVGLRVELSRIPSSSSRVATGFDPATLANAVTDADAVCAGVNFSDKTYSCTSYVHSLAAALPENFKQVFGTGLHGRDGRAGVAWDPIGDGKTAVRTGAGIFGGTFPFDLIDEARSTYDQFLPINWGQPSRAGSRWKVSGVNAISFSYPNFFPPNVNPFIFLVSDGFGLAPVKIENVGNSYSIQLAFSVERQLDSHTTLNAAYVSTMGRHLLSASTPNGGPGSSLTDITDLTTPAFPFPQYYDHPRSGITPNLPRTGVYPTVFDGGGSSTYHSLQLEVSRRQTRSLELVTSFTWAHSIDNASDYYGPGGGPALPQSSASPSERGDSNFDSRHRVAGFAIWSAPFPSANKFLGGWKVIAKGQAQSGLPYTITSANDINGDGNLTDRLNQTTNLKFRPFPGDPRIQVIRTTSDLSSFFAQYGPCPNGSLICPQPLDGGVGRNTSRSLGMINLDVAMIKRGALGRFGGFELGLEGFNILNHANFSLPLSVIEAPGFGASVATIGTSRTFQLVLKKDF